MDWYIWILNIFRWNRVVFSFQFVLFFVLNLQSWRTPKKITKRLLWMWCDINFDVLFSHRFIFRSHSSHNTSHFIRHLIIRQGEWITKMEICCCFTRLFRFLHCSCSLYALSLRLKTKNCYFFSLEVECWIFRP